MTATPGGTPIDRDAADGETFEVVTVGTIALAGTAVARTLLRDARLPHDPHANHPAT